MKALFSLSIAIALQLTFSNATFAQDVTKAEGLLHACEIFDKRVKFHGDSVTIPADPAAYVCWGYLSATQDYSVIVPGDKPIPMMESCPPPETTLTQLIHVFVVYGEAHPEVLHLKAGIVVHRAMKAAFPCPAG